MNLTIDDLVDVIIVDPGLHGLHQVEIVGDDARYYSAILIATSHKLYNKSQRLTARVLRIHDKYVDMVPNIYYKTNYRRVQSERIQFS